MIGWRFYLEAAFNSLGAWVLTYLIFSTVLFGALAAIARLRPLAPSVENLAWRVVLVTALLLTTARIAAEHVGIEIPVGPDLLVVSGTTGRVILAGVGLSGVVVALLTVRLWRLARGEYHSLRNRGPFEDAETAATLAELSGGVGRRMPRLTCSPTLRAPVAIGRDEICLPADFTRLFGGDSRRAILAHELGHLVRRDPTWRTAAQVLQRLLFFQPLQRLATRRLRETSEFVADEFAIRLTGRVEALVEALLTLTDREYRRPMQFAAGFSPGSLLLRRMRLALGEATTPRPIASPILLGVVVLLLATAWAAPAVVPSHDCRLLIDWASLLGA